MFFASEAVNHKMMSEDIVSSKDAMAAAVRKCQCLEGITSLLVAHIIDISHKIIHDLKELSIIILELLCCSTILVDEQLQHVEHRHSSQFRSFVVDACGVLNHSSSDVTYMDS